MQCSQPSAGYVPRGGAPHRSFCSTPGGRNPAERSQPSARARRQGFYQTYFQTPGVAEKEFEANPRRTFRIIFGSPPESGRTTNGLDPGRGVLDGREEPKQLPSWLKPEDIDYYVKEFSRTGFRGGLNWYRAQNISWEQTPFLTGRKLLQPTLFITGTADLVYEFRRADVDNLEKSAPNLWKKVLLPGVGHWTEQEASTEVKRLLIEFLRHVDSTGALLKNPK